ncbi:hypothetical protein [Williamsia sp. 1135]|uniref:hypothetical protein n=1 Tax=Williamsia sp. 1135 TaxID=1889262 RepID=UPI000A118B7D|nr:hypothetical protein [Williamsia sp. 1135]ORM31853.1 hypothetical protein BFL43_17435 [Williamsia sp. 1135]
MASRPGPVSVTSRTEYRLPIHDRLATVASALAAAALLELVVLTIVDTDPVVTGLVVIATLGLSLLLAAFGRVIDLPGISITVDDEMVHFGNEVVIHSFPLADLLSVKQSTELSSDTSVARSSRADQYRVRGCRYLQFRFASNPDQEWQVATIESDPAAAEVVSRLRAQQPKKRKVSVGKTMGDLAKPAQAEPDYQPTQPQPDRQAPRIANAGSAEAAERLWQAAIRQHEAVLIDYAQYELEPELLLRFPAVTDVSVDTVVRFHTALSRAQELRTERFPVNLDRADEYQQAVMAVRKAWADCEKYGRAVGAGLLDVTDQRELTTALSLLENARHTEGAQQADYLDRIHHIVTDLADRGSLHPQQQAIDEIEAGRRRALEAE